MEDENGVVTPEVTETEELELDEIIDESEPEESVEELKARLAKAEEIANNQRIRAEKAEKAKKETVQEPATQSQISNADAMALIKANVHEDDIDRVERYAKAEGLSLREALATSELKAILAVRTEERTTAAAANVSSVRRGSSKPTPEAILTSAKAGNLPDSDADIEALMLAKLRENKG